MKKSSTAAAAAVGTTLTQTSFMSDQFKQFYQTHRWGSRIQ